MQSDAGIAVNLKMEGARKFYEAQKQNREAGTAGNRQEVIDSWLKENTVDAWRHNRMLAYVDPFLRAHPGAKWLTVGDGRWGFETRYLLRKDPAADVMTTDISEFLLKESKQRGLIQKYSVENCESLSFPDRAFDYVLCKESFHHFPRPYVALYEMLRVSTGAVILIEPQDPVLDNDRLQEFRKMKDGNISWHDTIRALLRRSGLITVLRKIKGVRTQDSPAVQAEFEPSGNFLYSLSQRELEKVALGIGMPAAAFARLSDYYEEGVELEPAAPESALFRKVQEKIAEADANQDCAILVAALFHRVPGILRKSLGEQGLVVIDLPANPYI